MKQLFVLISSLALFTGCGRDYSVKAQHLPRKRVEKPKPISKETPAEKKKRRDAETWHHKTTKDMTYEELKQAKTVALAADDKEKAMEYLARMLVLGSDLGALQEVRLELADLCFDTGELSEAEIGYKGFVTLYPGSEYVEYVRYRTVLCCFYQTLDAERDQTKTKETIKLAQDFLKNPEYKQYAADIKTISNQCTDQLFESEKNIFTFYVERNQLASAERRLGQMKDQFERITRFVPMILALECQLAQTQGNTILFQEKQTALAKLTEAVSDKKILATNNSPTEPPLSSTSRRYSARF
jgi:outer membrane assembly lipoprotein YfiO